MRRAAVGIAVFATVLVASGCASSATKKPTASVVSPAPGRQAGSTSVVHPVVLPLSPKALRGIDPPEGARFLSPTRLAIGGIAGSSNCPSVPKKLIVQSRHRIRVDLAVGSWGRTASGRRVQVPHRPRICLADLHPVPVVIAIDPARIDVHDQLSVSLYYPKFAGPRYRRPVVVTAPPFPTARIREIVMIARTSHPRLFRIFPTAPGEERCVIPHRAPPPQDFGGVCRTTVRSRRTMEPSWSVVFTESWWPNCPPMTACSPRALRHHTWRVSEGETIVRRGSKPRVYATRSSGFRPPQS